MTFRQYLAVLAVLTLPWGFTGCTKTGNDERARLLKDVDSTLTYDVVAKDVPKHSGKRVGWYGLFIGSYPVAKDGKDVQVEFYTYLPTEKDSGVDFEKPYMFNTSDGTDMRTDAAKKAEKKLRRLLIGTIAGSGEFKVNNRIIMAPVLKDVSIFEQVEQ